MKDACYYDDDFGLYCCDDCYYYHRHVRADVAACNSAFPMRSHLKCHQANAGTLFWCQEPSFCVVIRGGNTDTWSNFSRDHKPRTLNFDILSPCAETLTLNPKLQNTYTQTPRQVPSTLHSWTRGLANFTPPGPQIETPSP